MIRAYGFVVACHAKTQMAFVLAQFVWLGMVLEPSKLQQKAACAIRQVHQNERAVGCFLATMIPKAERISVKPEDRKSTRLNSSHANISYAVFCLKKKKFNS